MIIEILPAVFPHWGNMNIAVAQGKESGAATTRCHSGCAILPLIARVQISVQPFSGDAIIAKVEHPKLKT